MRARRRPRAERHLRPASTALLCAIGGLIAACGDVSAPPDTSPEATIARGHAAFVESCARCHASRDGFDLGFFGFDSATIVRRAVRHVSTETGRAIAAYIRSLGLPAQGRSFRPFQPGATTVGSDADFWT